MHKTAEQWQQIKTCIISSVMRREAADVWFRSVVRHNHKHFAAPFLMLIISFLCWKVYITVALAPSSTFTRPQHIGNNELLTFLQLFSCEICFHAPFCAMICATPSRLFTPSALWKAGSVDTNNTAKPRRRLYQVLLIMSRFKPVAVRQQDAQLPRITVL